MLNFNTQVREAQAACPFDILVPSNEMQNLELSFREEKPPGSKQKHGTPWTEARI